MASDAMDVELGSKKKALSVLADQYLIEADLLVPAHIVPILEARGYPCHPAPAHPGHHQCAIAGRLSPSELHALISCDGVEAAEPDSDDEHEPGTEIIDVTDLEDEAPRAPKRRRKFEDDDG